eukprot:gene10205-biopygen11515
MVAPESGRRQGKARVPKRPEGLTRKQQERAITKTEQLQPGRLKARGAATRARPFPKRPNRAHPLPKRPDRAHPLPKRPNRAHPLPKRPSVAGRPATPSRRRTAQRARGGLRATQAAAAAAAAEATGGGRNDGGTCCGEVPQLDPTLRWGNRSSRGGMATAVAAGGPRAPSPRLVDVRRPPNASAVRTCGRGRKDEIDGSAWPGRVARLKMGASTARRRAHRQRVCTLQDKWGPRGSRQGPEKQWEPEILPSKARVLLPRHRGLKGHEGMVEIQPPPGMTMALLSQPGALPV